MSIVRAGTAGWTIPRDVREEFPLDGSSLERYAAVFSCAEINSTFYRSHRKSTYARWASSVPPEFRFSAKLPREITHKRKLAGCDDLLDSFLEETAELGERLGVYVVQLAPSHSFDATIAPAFFKSVREKYGGGLACEPRHESWNSAEASEVLRKYRITRIGADPQPFEGAGTSDAFGGFSYYRWHGAPRTYYSSYERSRLAEFATSVRETSAGEVWCIFDNTAAGAAVRNALEFRDPDNSHFRRLRCR